MTGVWPQPYEGVYAVDRGDTDLLSLDGRARAHRDALYAMGRLLHHTVLAGDAAPAVAALWDRISRPHPGDLVIEVSARRPDTRLIGLGVLLAQRTEWKEPDIEWEQFCTRQRVHNVPGADVVTSADARATVHATYVQYGPAAGPAGLGPGSGDVSRWTGARFTVLPVGVTPRWLETEADRHLPAARGVARGRPGP